MKDEMNETRNTTPAGGGANAGAASAKDSSGAGGEAGAADNSGAGATGPTDIGYGGGAGGPETGRGLTNSESAYETSDVEDTEDQSAAEKNKGRGV